MQFGKKIMRDEDLTWRKLIKKSISDNDFSDFFGIVPFEIVP